MLTSIFSELAKAKCAVRASTIYLHMAAIIGGGNLTKEETKKFWKD